MKQLGRISVLLVLLFLVPVAAGAERLLVPVGRIVGLQLRDDTVTVAAFEETGSGGKSSGLKIGDRIIKVNDICVSSVEEVRSALEAEQGKVTLTICRGSRQMTLAVEPEKTPEGPRLGVYLRQGITGIGTVTWYDPETACFGALGHGVNDSGGCLLHMTQGTAYFAQVNSVNRGRCGQPGQLRGAAGSDSPCGELTRNTPQGVFGISPAGWLGQPVAAASANQLHTGKAVILSTVCGNTPKEYAVEIVKVYPSDRVDGRNLLLKVTDAELLETTGGIVQGMSGSPILQDGRLVGAVTHVLVNDPTMGYGIFIGNMLDAAA